MRAIPKELSPLEPQSLSEWFEREHNLTERDASDQARKMTDFFTAQTIRYAKGKTTPNLN